MEQSPRLYENELPDVDACFCLAEEVRIVAPEEGVQLVKLTPGSGEAITGHVSAVDLTFCRLEEKSLVDDEKEGEERHGEDRVDRHLRGEQV